MSMSMGLGAGAVGVWPGMLCWVSTGGMGGGCWYRSRGISTKSLKSALLNNQNST